MNHEVLPGELTTFRAVGATGFGLGAIGCVALWLTAAIRRVAVQDSGSSHVGATTACATYPHDGETLDELMRVADGRLLERKRARPQPVR